MSAEYNAYLKEHIHAVGECLRLLAITAPSRAALLDEETVRKIIVNHDRSKYTKEEYQAYDEYFFTGSIQANLKERFEEAWLHHIHNNPHHWQYWTIPEGPDSIKPIEMPKLAILEMIADWGSFAYRKKDGQELINWYENHRDVIVLARKTRAIVNILVSDLAAAINEWRPHED